MIKIIIFFIIFMMTTQNVVAEDRLNYIMYEACKTGDIATVKRMIERGVDVNIKSDFFAHTALMLATYNGHLDIVNYLLSKGADANIGFPLADAVEYGHIEIVRSLVEKGDADVNITISSKTLLSYVISYNDEYTALGAKMAKILISGGADLKGELISAVESGRTEIVKHLISSGANIKEIDSYGKTAFMIAKEKGYNEIAAFLFENSIFDEYKTIIESYKGQPAIADIKKMIEVSQSQYLNRDTSFKGIAFKEGTYVLSIILILGYNDLGESLIKAGAVNINEYNNYGYSTSNVLIDTVKNNNINAVKMLIKYDVNINSGNEKTALYFAIENENIDMVNTLLEAKIKPNYLYDALKKNNTEIAKTLIDYKANISTGSFITSIENKNIDIINYIIATGYDINGNNGQELLACIENNNVEIAKILIKNGADVNTSYDNYTPLAKACEKGYIDIVTLLIENYADVNNGSNSYTLLEIARNNGHDDIVALLETLATLE